jgi:hypothetical protein
MLALSQLELLKIELVYKLCGRKREKFKRVGVLLVLRKTIGSLWGNAA